MRIDKFLQDSALFNLAITYDEVIGGVQKRLAKEDVQFLEALVLTGIFFEERALRPTELAAAFSQSKSNMSHILRRLELKKWIERSSAEDDARAYLFSLTKEGRKKTLKLIKFFDATQAQIEGAVAGKKVNQSLKVFRRIFKRIK